MFSSGNRCTCKATEVKLKQMTHDLRSPVAALGFSIEHLLRDSCFRGPAENVMRASLERIRAILEDARVACSRSATDVELNQVLDLISREKEQEYRGKLRVRLVNRRSGKIEIKAHKSGLERMLSNVLNNAAEALINQNPKSEGPLVVGIEVVTESNLVGIRVSDGGPGMPDEVLERLGKVPISFGKKDGMGLGLYHAAQTLQSWGGRLEVQSTDAGTDVTLWVPRV